MQKNIFSNLLKLLITGMFIYFVTQAIDIKIVVQNVMKFSPVIVVSALILLMVQMIFYNLRLYCLIRYNTKDVDKMKLLPIVWGTIFLSQILPGGLVVGDLIKLKSLRDTFNIEFKHALVALFFERLLMLFVLCVVVVATFWILPIDTASKGYFQWICGVAVLLLVSSLIVYKLRIKLSFIQSMVSFLCEHLNGNIKYLGLAIIFSFIILCFSIGVFYMLSNYFAQHISFWVYIPLCSIVLLITAIPISFAGWGLREGGCLLLMPLLGFTNEQAVTISVAFGLLLFIASFPGAVHGLQLLLKVWSGRESNKRLISTPT